MTAFFERRAIAETASKSPSEAIGKAGLDDVDAHRVEQVGDLELFLEGHGRAGALLAVAQRGVEDQDLVLVGAGRLVRCVRSCVIPDERIFWQPALEYMERRGGPVRLNPLSAQAKGPAGAQGRLRRSRPESFAQASGRRGESAPRPGQIMCGQIRHDILAQPRERGGWMWITQGARRGQAGDMRRRMTIRQSHPPSHMTAAIPRRVATPPVRPARCGR